MNRRKYIKKSSALLLAAPYTFSQFNSTTNSELDLPLEVHLFSKHLQFLDLKEAAQVAKELGFRGLDVTVRPKGHVLPENVMTDLPEAIRQIKESGSTCEMITTAVESAKNEIDLKLIMTAAQHGVKYYRSNWFEFKEELTLEDSLDHFRKKIFELGQVNKEHNIIGCYQNHSGTKIGASVWEVKKILETVDSKFFGVQYDIRHAVVEGGRSWPNGIKLLKDQLKTIVLKDFKWGKVDGRWKIVNVPIGHGMVNFSSYFRLLKSYGLRPPVSLHLEYPLGGAEKGRYEITVDKKVVFDAMKNDLETIHLLWKKA